MIPRRGTATVTHTADAKSETLETRETPLFLNQESGVSMAGIQSLFGTVIRIIG